MANICYDCAACETERCPRYGDDLEKVEYGCLNYTKLPVINNPNKHVTRCGECRFLFQKPRKDAQDKSYVNCGAVASMVKHIKPIPNCPYFKPLRKRQLFKRRKKNAKKVDNKVNNNYNRENRGGEKRYGKRW